MNDTSAHILIAVDKIVESIISPTEHRDLWIRRSAYLLVAEWARMAADECRGELAERN